MPECLPQTSLKVLNPGKSLASASFPILQWIHAQNTANAEELSRTVGKEQEVQGAAEGLGEGFL